MDPELGFRVTFSDIELRYQGWASSASHFPFIDLGGGESLAFPDSPGAATILAAPRGNLVIPDLTVTSHRLAISVPIR